MTTSGLLYDSPYLTHEDIHNMDTRPGATPDTVPGATPDTKPDDNPGSDGDRDEENADVGVPSDDDGDFMDGLVNLPRVNKSPGFYPGRW